MLDSIAKRCRGFYEICRHHLEPLEAEGLLRLSYIPEDCTGNYHLFYILLHDMQARDAVMTHIKQRGIYAVCPYAPLHSFPIGKEFG
jgi:dTDP-4-amino-4,6-dideoxygalactose transaminase